MTNTLTEYSQEALPPGEIVEQGDGYMFIEGVMQQETAATIASEYATLKGDPTTWEWETPKGWNTDTLEAVRKLTWFMGPYTTVDEERAKEAYHATLEFIEQFASDLNMDANLALFGEYEPNTWIAPHVDPVDDPDKDSTIYCFGLAGSGLFQIHPNTKEPDVYTPVATSHRISVGDAAVVYPQEGTNQTPLHSAVNDTDQPRLILFLSLTPK